MLGCEVSNALPSVEISTVHVEVSAIAIDPAYTAFVTFLEFLKPTFVDSMATLVEENILFGSSSFVSSRRHIDRAPLPLSRFTIVS